MYEPWRHASASIYSVGCGSGQLLEWALVFEPIGVAMMAPDFETFSSCPARGAARVRRPRSEPALRYEASLLETGGHAAPRLPEHDQRDCGWQRRGDRSIL